MIPIIKILQERGAKIENTSQGLKFFKYFLSFEQNLRVIWEEIIITEINQFDFDLISRNGKY